MTTATSHEPLFRLRSGAQWRDPFGMYARLRAESPVHHVTDDPSGADFWVLTRHADVMAAATDPTTFSSAAGLTVVDGEIEAIGMADNPPMVMQDPPGHTAFRALVARGFTPRQVQSIRPRIHDFVTTRLDEIADHGPATPVDIAHLLLKPMPSMLVAHYLGVPEKDWARFDEWTEAIVGAVGGTADPGAGTAGAATGELLGYFADLIAQRRTEGATGSDTVSTLVAAGRADDDAGLVSILAFVFTMIAGGNDTTTGLLGGSLALLSEHPDQRAQLVADPSLIGDAVEELLRLTSPVQGLCRSTTRPVRYDTPDGPVEIPAGRKVLLCYAAANRDPEVFGADAEALDVTRRPRGILTFSHGDHHCLGAAAARMAADVTLTELLARFPEFEVDVDGIEWAAGHYVRRPTCVPFRSGPVHR